MQIHELLAKTLLTAVKINLRKRFVIFVARGKRPIVSFSDFGRAELFAIILAGSTNTKMEIFDSKKEVCYFVDPSEAKCLFLQQSS